MNVVEQAATLFLPRYQSLLPVSSGFSGSRVFRVKTEEGDFALKQYPPNCSSARLREIHLMQAHAASNLKTVPDLLAVVGSTSSSLSPETLLCLDGGWFDCSRWLPGRPIQVALSNAEDDRLDRQIAAGAAAIAEFHNIVLSLGVHSASAPAVLERQQRLRELQRVLPSAIMAARQLQGSAAGPISPQRNPWPFAAERLSDWLAHGFGQSIQTLASWSETQLPIQWVLRDVHREHLLFEQESVTGLIDFDAARPDTVAVDLARWAGSFIDLGLEKTRIWNAVLNGYQAVRPISACEQQLAGAMEEISWHLRLANWVVWVALEQRVFPGTTITPEARLWELLSRNGSFKAI